MLRSLARFQWFAVLPVGIVFVCVTLFWDLIQYAVMTNVILNGIILSTMLAGVVIMHFLIWGLRKEWTVLDSFYRRVNAGEEISGVLHEKTIENSEVGRVLTHISSGPLSLANRSVQAAIETQIETLGKILSSRQELAQFLVGFMIALGLLGTFIGILETLTYIGDLMASFTTTDFSSGNVMGAFIAELAKPMRGMGTAFSASMFGLAGSLCLGLTMVALSRATNELINDVHDVIAKTTKIPSFDTQGLGSGTDLHFLTGFLADLLGQQREVTAMFNESIQNGGRVVRCVESLERGLGNLCTKIDKQQDAIAETNALLRDNPVVQRITDQFLNEVRMLASMSAENSANLSGLIPAVNGVTQRISAFIDTLLHQRGQIETTLSTVAKSHGLIESGVLSAFEHEAKLRTSIHEELSQVRKLMMEIRPAASAAAPMVSEINHRLNEQLFSLNELQESLRYMTQTVAQSFSGIKSGITEMLVDSQQNRDIQKQAITKMINMQELTAQLAAVNQTLALLSDSNANNTLSSEILLDEVRGVKTGILRELRLDMREWELRRSTQKNSPGASGNTSVKEVNS